MGLIWSEMAEERRSFFTSLTNLLGNLVSIEVVWSKLSQKFCGVTKDGHYFINVALIMKKYNPKTLVGFSDNNWIMGTKWLECTEVFTSPIGFPGWHPSCHISLGTIIMSRLQVTNKVSRNGRKSPKLCKQNIKFRINLLKFNTARLNAVI